MRRAHVALILLPTGTVFANSIKSYLVWQNVSQQVFHYQRQIQILHTKKERKKNKKTKPNQIPLYFYQCSNDIFGYFGDQCVLMRRAQNYLLLMIFLIVIINQTLNC